MPPVAVHGPAPGPAVFPWEPSRRASTTGTLAGAPAAAPAGIWVAFGERAVEANPTRVRIDDRSGISVVTGWSVRRGRSYVTDKMNAGTASISFVDKLGKLDPTNTTGPFWPMDPNCPAGIALYNPVSTNWVPIFTGLVQQVPQTLNEQSTTNRGSIELADLFSLLAISEVPAGYDFTDNADGTYTPAGNTTGNTKYAESTVQDRIKALLADAGVPSALTNIFTGNVRVSETTYAPGEKILSAIQDAADAEFPGVANVYIGKDGRVNFRGRLARFDPTTYGIHTWNVADTAGIVGHTNRAVIANNGLLIDRDVTKVINSARFTPQGIADTDIAGQLVQDAASIAKYGLRDFSGDNLICAGGTAGTTYAGNPLGETKMYGTFWVNNLKDAATRVQQARFRWLNASHANADYHWNFLCNVEIDDIIAITATHPGGGGLSAERFFVEGITYDAQLGRSDIWDLTMTLDLSPAAYWATAPTHWNSAT